MQREDSIPESNDELSPEEIFSIQLNNELFQALNSIGYRDDWRLEMRKKFIVFIQSVMELHELHAVKMSERRPGHNDLCGIMFRKTRRAFDNFIAKFRVQTRGLNRAFFLETMSREARDYFLKNCVEVSLDYKSFECYLEGLFSVINKEVYLSSSSSTTQNDADLSKSNNYQAMFASKQCGDLRRRGYRGSADSIVKAINEQNELNPGLLSANRQVALTTEKYTRLINLATTTDEYNELSKAFFELEYSTAYLNEPNLEVGYRSKFSNQLISNVLLDARSRIPALECNRLFEIASASHLLRDLLSVVNFYRAHESQPVSKCHFSPDDEERILKKIQQLFEEKRLACIEKKLIDLQDFKNSKSPGFHQFIGLYHTFTFALFDEDYIGNFLAQRLPGYHYAPSYSELRIPMVFGESLADINQLNFEQFSAVDLMSFFDRLNMVIGSLRKQEFDFYSLKTQLTYKLLAETNELNIANVLHLLDLKIGIQAIHLLTLKMSANEINLLLAAINNSNDPSLSKDTRDILLRANRNSPRCVKAWFDLFRIIMLHPESIKQIPFANLKKVDSEFMTVLADFLSNNFSSNFIIDRFIGNQSTSPLPRVDLNLKSSISPENLLKILNLNFKERKAIVKKLKAYISSESQRTLNQEEFLNQYFTVLEQTHNNSQTNIPGSKLK